MRALIQRVSSASVNINHELESEIGSGLLVLLGVAAGDTAADAEKLANRVLEYRVFADADGRMNQSLQDGNGDLLVVSQFTLCADTHKGKRPGFSTAAEPQLAEHLYNLFVKAV